jgi:sigma-E factor negative regulatory protein RseA
MKDELSALLDNDLDDDASSRALDALRRDPDLRARWGAYCLIGDVLRGERGGSADFTSRVMAQVRAEPTVLAPKASAVDAVSESARAGGALQPLFAVAASVMGVAAVGWVAMSMLGGEDTLPVIAGIEPAVQFVEQVALPASVAGLAQQSDPHRKYVFVHQAMNGGGPIPGAVQYVRTVSADLGDVRR